jgi:hypothetical protein
MPNSVAYANDHMPSPMQVTRLMTMIRSPASHIVSQYAQCQVEGAFSYSAHGAIHPVTFAEFVELAANGSFSEVYCGNSPYNLQVRQLAPFSLKNGTNLGDVVNEMNIVDKPINVKRQRQLIANALPIALETIESAYYVGINEYFEASMCLLHYQHDGAIPEWCTCEVAYAGWPTSMGVPEFPHDDHGNNPYAVEQLIYEGLKLASSITEADQVLYAAALKRFNQQMTSLGLGCVITV